MKLVQTSFGLQLLQESQSRDFAPDFTPWATRKVAGLMGFDGALFKSRSPSCAIQDCKVRQNSFGGEVVGFHPGLFQQSFSKKFPQLIRSDEEVLKQTDSAFAFYLGLFIQARWRESSSSWADFYSHHYFLLRLYPQQALTELALLKEPKALQAAFSAILQAGPEPSAWPQALALAYARLKRKDPSPPSPQRPSARWLVSELKKLAQRPLPKPLEIFATPFPWELMP